MINLQNNSPAGASGGAGAEKCAWLGANGYPHFTPSRPACQSLFRRWLAQARACAARDLAAADRARASGDLEAFHRLRRRGLRHQVLQVALEAALGG